MSRNFYLYFAQGISKNLCNINNVYCFKNDLIIAIDKNIYGRKQRYEFQKYYRMSPYYISQQVLKEILMHSLKEPNLFYLRDIEFIDKYVEDTPDFDFLKNLILKYEVEDIYKNVHYILNEYDTEILKIRFRYKGFDFCLNTEGVLDVEAPSDIIEEFIEDNITNKLILGLAI
ncbi:hypothetical protein [Clostridium tetani]|uniref:hypothetical protein n=1 Tax=Clostridium tetani TaxID=1513 RepID=UPI00100B4C11|nr:hypothetical protein [Clostridium tetani]RXM68346.1 hypothetical protein DP139_12245 [Clostridium tetani]